MIPPRVAPPRKAPPRKALSQTAPPQTAQPQKAPAQTYGPATGLVVVDVQNDFADPVGSLSVPGALAVVAQVNAEVEAAVSGGATIVYTQDWHPRQTPHFSTPDPRWQPGPWPPHCVADTWGAELHPDLLVRGERVKKGQGFGDGYSGFSETDARGMVVANEDYREPFRPSPTALAGLLPAAGVVELVVVGLATDYCVRATALDARALGWPVIVPRSAVAAVDVHPGDGGRALAELEAAGARLS